MVVSFGDSRLLMSHKNVCFVGFLPWFDFCRLFECRQKILTHEAPENFLDSLSSCRIVSPIFLGARHPSRSSRPKGSTTFGFAITFQKRKVPKIKELDSL